MDSERVLIVLEGLQAPAQYAGLFGKIAAARGWGKHQTFVEAE